MRSSASLATGDFVCSHTSKILRRQCAQQATSMIGPGLVRAGWYSAWNPLYPSGLEEAGKPSHVRRRTLATAVGAVEVGGCRRSVAAERPVVAHVDPQPPGLG